MEKEFKGLTFFHNSEFPDVIELRDHKWMEISSCYTWGDGWRISDDTSSTPFHFLFNYQTNGEYPHDTKYSAMREMLYRFNKFIKRYNDNGINNKVRYKNVHQNEHMKYTTEEYFSIKR